MSGLTYKVTVTSMLSAVTVASNYALFPLFQIKLMDPIVFVSAYLFGLRVGCSVAAITWLVYGTLNPLGSAGFPLLLILIAGEMFYAISGSLLARVWGGFTDFNFRSGLLGRSLTLGVIGLLSAFAYDLWTNAVDGLLIYWSVQGVVLRILSGIYFATVHEVADFFLFAFIVPVLILAIRRAARPVLNPSGGGVV